MRPHPATRRRVLVAVALAVTFGAGLAFGRALEERPPPGGTQTLVRTLTPLPLAPAARATVTVTVQNP